MASNRDTKTRRRTEVECEAHVPSNEPACLPSEGQSESNGHRHGNQGSVVSFSIGMESRHFRCAPGWKQCVTSPPRQAHAACRDGAWWPQTLVNIYPLQCRQAASPNPGSVGEGGAVPSEPAVGTHVATNPTNLHRNVAEGSMGAPWTLDRQPARARLGVEPSANSQQTPAPTWRRNDPSPASRSPRSRGRGRERGSLCHEARRRPLQAKAPRERPGAALAAP